MFTFQPINFVWIKEVSSKEIKRSSRQKTSVPTPAPHLSHICLKPQMFPLPYRCAKKKSNMPGFHIFRRRNKRQQEGRKALLYLEWGELGGKWERARCPGRGAGTPVNPGSPLTLNWNYSSHKCSTHLSGRGCKCYPDVTFLMLFQGSGYGLCRDRALGPVESRLSRLPSALLPPSLGISISPQCYKSTVNGITKGKRSSKFTFYYF